MYVQLSTVGFWLFAVLLLPFSPLYRVLVSSRFIYIAIRYMHENNKKHYFFLFLCFFLWKTNGFCLRSLVLVISYLCHHLLLHTRRKHIERFFFLFLKKIKNKQINCQTKMHKYESIVQLFQRYLEEECIPGGTERALW